MNLFKFFLGSLLTLALALPTYAQQPNAGQPGTDAENKSALSGTRKQLATIIFAGLGGAVMGLSTLSFYGRPQDNMVNIALGFAVGIIGGTVYSTYKAAQPTGLEGPPRPQASIERNGALDGADLLSASSNTRSEADFGSTISLTTTVFSFNF